MIKDIYNNSLFTNSILMPVGTIGRLAGIVRYKRDVEKDTDTYKKFYLTAVELVDKSKLSAAMRKRIENDKHLSKGPVYLATFFSLGDDGEVPMERQVFLNGTMLHKLEVRKPKAGAPLGNGTRVLNALGVDITTLGQYWGNARPRAQKVETRAASDSDIDYINALLVSDLPCKRSPVARFMSPEA